MAKRIVFNEYKDKKMEEAAEIEFDSEHIYKIPPPELWGPDVYKASEAEDQPGMVDALTSVGTAEYISGTYGCSPAAFMSMCFESWGIDTGKLFSSVLTSTSTEQN